MLQLLLQRFNNGDVSELLSDQFVSEKMYNRKMLLLIFSSIRYLARQALPQKETSESIPGLREDFSQLPLILILHLLRQPPLLGSPLTTFYVFPSLYNKHTHIKVLVSWGTVQFKSYCHHYGRWANRCSNSNKISEWQVSLHPLLWSCIKLGCRRCCEISEMYKGRSERSGKTSKKVSLA